MKSLEIVNSAEKDLKILIDLIKQDLYYDFSLATRQHSDRLIRVCESLINTISNPIKQDLERLELLEKAIEIIKKPKNLDGLYTAFYDDVGVNEQEEEIFMEVLGECEDDD